MRKFIVSLAVAVTTLPTFGCETSDSYIELEKEWARTAEVAYASCASSIDLAGHWYRYGQCVSKNDAYDSELGCGDLADLPSSGYTALEVGIEICDVLKKGTELYQKNLRNVARRLEIKRCRET